MQISHGLKRSKMLLHVPGVVHGYSCKLHPSMSLKLALVATHANAQLASDTSMPEQAL
jgi:hypothetical protein